MFPLAKEGDIIGKWFVGIYQAKRTKRLYIGRLMKWFLDDESSNAYAIEMGYLKPKVDLGTIMEDTPDHLLILVYLTILTGKNLYFAEFSTKIY